MSPPPIPSLSHIPLLQAHTSQKIKTPAAAAAASVVHHHRNNTERQSFYLSGNFFVKRYPHCTSEIRFTRPQRDPASAPRRSFPRGPQGRDPEAGSDEVRGSAPRPSSSRLVPPRYARSALRLDPSSGGCGAERPARLRPGEAPQPAPVVRSGRRAGGRPRLSESQAAAARRGAGAGAGERGSCSALGWPGLTSRTRN